MSKWEEIGVIGVDAGMCWVGDPCYCVTPDADEHPAKTWGEFCEQIEKGQFYDNEYQQFCYKMGHQDLGVCVSSGYGDGTYPVFIKKNGEGRVVGLMVKFD